MPQQKSLSLKPRGRLKTNTGQDIFEIGILIISLILFVLPFINLAAVSLSSARATLSGEVFFWPVEIQYSTWQEVFRNTELIRSFFFTVMLTAVCTILSLLLIIMAAYPLSSRSLKGRGKLLGIFLVTMYFSGGLIPSYLLFQSINILDTFWVLVLPGAFSVYNMLILKSFFQGIPTSLEESAKMDGANDFKVLFAIFIPLSMPALATLALFFAVGRWNSFSDAIFFLPTRRDLIPLQLLLQRMLQVVADKEKLLQALDGTTRRILIIKESQKAANILFTVIPIIMIYPWLQKYFVKGVLIGSIKG